MVTALHPVEALRLTSLGEPCTRLEEDSDERGYFVRGSRTGPPYGGTQPHKLLPNPKFHTSSQTRIPHQQPNPKSSI